MSENNGYTDHDDYTEGSIYSNGGYSGSSCPDSVSGSGSGNDSESAGNGNSNGNSNSNFPSNGDGFMNIPDGIDEELPFN